MLRRSESGGLRAIALVFSCTLALDVGAGCGGDSGDGGGNAPTSGSAGTAGSSGDDVAGGDTSSGGTPADAGTGMGAEGGTDGVTAGDGGEGATGGACEPRSETVSLARQPVDVIVVVDNSGSMVEEIPAVEQALNESFASVLDAAGLDYRVILLSRHRVDERTSPVGTASTSLCITAPLSGATSCPVAEPVFTERFFHYATKIESYDALDWMVSGYSAPPIGVHADLAPNGYSAWIRSEAHQSFILFTDDDEGGGFDPTVFTADGFIRAMSALSVEHFGAPDAPSFSFHSVVGIRERATVTAAYPPSEPIQTQVCTGNASTVGAPGVTYQELSRVTGGLRFPVCQLGAFDAAFEAIADELARRAEVDCAVAVPDALGADATGLSARFVSNGASEDLALVPDADACAEDSFYVDAGRVQLCPETCERARLDPALGLELSRICE